MGLEDLVRVLSCRGTEDRAVENIFATAETSNYEAESLGLLSIECHSTSFQMQSTNRRSEGFGGTECRAARA